MNSVCRRRSVGSKRAQKGSVNSVCSVRDKTPQRISSVLSHMEGAFYFSQKNTEEQNTQGFTETLSQPISQSVTANVSWKASVNSVCRRPSVRSKLCAKMLSELCVLCERKISPRDSPMFYFSQKNTEEQNTQGSERWWPLPLPLPRREERNHRDTPMANHQHLTSITHHPSMANP